MRSVQPELPFDLPFERLLDGGSDWEYFQPVRAGDQITAVGRVSDISERSGRVGLMVFIKTMITYRNQFDEIAATQTNTLIRY
jgi:hydroxyacyl-ACP dehydratase HTD2-like protein with hotdog domain